jgi:hypothetical protein
LVPGGTQFCEEAGVLETVTQLATGWYDRYIPGTAH